MRVVQINAVPYGSTGKIMFQLADMLETEDNQVLCTSGFTWQGSTRGDFFLTSNIWGKTLHRWLAEFTGRVGCYSVDATKKLLQRMDTFQPELIHLHNLHGWFVNIPMLFSYIKEKNIPVVWTFHDCWPLTGHCPHFTMVQCDRWKSGCHHCSQYREYPQSFVDRSKIMWNLKRKWFAGVKNMTIVTPSQWLANQVKESFLKDYPVKVIHNGIDLAIFKPSQSDFRKKYNCEDQFLLLGVAFDWGPRKGLDVFMELEKRLDDRFRIVLVGTNDAIDKQLPAGIISIHRTQSQQELAQIYSAADLFVNPTREDTYPTVNMEAIACGTPVLTFRTGGSPEIPDETCGSVVECDDVDALQGEIERIAQQRPFTKEACLNRAKAFDAGERFAEYLKLYEQILSVSL